MAIVRIECLRCTNEFDNNTRASSRYCLSCRKARKLEADNERRRQVREDQKMLREVAESMRGYLDPSMYVKVEDYLSSLGVSTYYNASVVVDRMPDGSDSPAGPDDGMSTTDPDLADWLDVRRMDVIMHDWFKDHPHWTVGMHGA